MQEDEPADFSFSVIPNENTEESIETTDSADASKSRRPPNAYILYCLEKRSELRMTHPELPNIEISRMLGQNWKSLEEHVRRPYKEKAKILQAEFKKEHPDYKYEKARKKRITQEMIMSNSKSNAPTILDIAQIFHPELLKYIQMNAIKQTNGGNNPSSPPSINPPPQKDLTSNESVFPPDFPYLSADFQSFE